MNALGRVLLFVATTHMCFEIRYFLYVKPITSDIWVSAPLRETLFFWWPYVTLTLRLAVVSCCVLSADLRSVTSIKSVSIFQNTNPQTSNFTKHVVQNYLQLLSFITIQYRHLFRIFICSSSCFRKLSSKKSIKIVLFFWKSA